MAAGLKYGNDYFVKTGSGSRNNSGPAGRKLRGYRMLMRNLVDAAKHYSCVVWCSDSHKNRGSGFPPKK